jgi:hypothetical protein
MPYLGNEPATQFTDLKYQDLTGETGSPAKRGFTLDYAVGNAQAIEVYVNNVRQEPGVAYTVSGTTLTMTGDVETTDDFYVVFQGMVTSTATHPATSNLEADYAEFTGTVEIKGNLPFWENTATVNTDYTITNDRNALSIGPITIADGVTVTVGSGETWTVI